MRQLICLVLVLLCASTSYGQGNAEVLEGKVTFTTSRNVYVKFDHTERITVGDTLRWSVDGVLMPCLTVTQKSSTSCVCTILNECDIEVDDQIFYEFVPEEQEVVQEVDVSELSPQMPVVTQTANSSPEPAQTELIRGRLSAASYSNFSGNGDERHRMMYRLSVNANNIGDSKFSAETYLNYRQNFLAPGETSIRPTKFFRVYNLAVRYDADSTTSLVLGRRINNKVSSLGAIDGLQGEKHFGSNYVGALVGFRPDIFEYTLNTNLLQYGAYIGRSTSNGRLYAQTTLGVLEQRNTGQIDRRYLYFQHSSNIGRKLNLFGSMEFDVYQRVNEVVANTPRLTNLYVSARYRFSRKVNVSIAYDSRKRILFYETLRTEIEQLLADDESRQGLRLRVQVRPLKLLTVGAAYSRRFQSSLQNKSENINGFASLSRIPKFGGRLTLNFNMNTSNYLESMIISARHSRTLIERKLDADFYYRWVHYHFFDSRLKTSSSYIGMGLNFRINRELLLGVLGEYSIQPTDRVFRVNFRIIKRFSSR